MKYETLHRELEKRGYGLIKRDQRDGVVYRVAYGLDGEPTSLIQFPLDQERDGTKTVDDMIANSIMALLLKQDAW